MFVLLLVGLSAQAADRSHTIRAEFMRQHPCPSTGATKGRCPGWEADHWTPLCIGGADSVQNMRWLTVADHKVKTRSDVRLCRSA